MFIFIVIMKRKFSLPFFLSQKESNVDICGAYESISVPHYFHVFISNEKKSMAKLLAQPGGSLGFKVAGFIRNKRRIVVFFSYSFELGRLAAERMLNSREAV